MRQSLAALLLAVSAQLVFADTVTPPVNNAVPPCDHSESTRKPACDMDSDSVNQPPEMPHEKGVIVPPEIPAKGLPNRKAPRDNPIETPATRDKSLSH